MQKITPHFWFNTEAQEAAEFYSKTFPNSKVIQKTTYTHIPSGDCDVVDFEIMGYKFQAINAGDHFTPNPSVSFMINFDPSQDPEAKKNIDIVWNSLIEGGKILMPIDTYPFSERCGWVQDKYGFSWQLILTHPEGDERPLVIPCFLFVTESCMKAEEARDFYIKAFQNTKEGSLMRHPKNAEPHPEGSVLFTDFKLENQWFAAMDGSTQMHKFQFNEAISFIINCKNQEEIDYFFNTLSANQKAAQCGWVKDKFGVSWQIFPHNMHELMSKDFAKTVPAMLKMKKIHISELENAVKNS